MTAPRRPSAGLRVYVIIFDVVLIAVAVLFAVLGATGSDERRGGYVGMAILWAAMALGAVALTVALERMLRRPPGEAPRGD